MRVKSCMLIVSWWLLGELAPFIWLGASKSVVAVRCLGSVAIDGDGQSRIRQRTTFEDGCAKCG